jgi:hypothetical protein
MPYENFSTDLKPLSEAELDQIRQPVFDIVRARLRDGDDTRYDHFKWDHEIVPNPLIEQGGITDSGTMLYMYRNAGVVPLEWTGHGFLDNPHAWQAALANMHDNNGNYTGIWQPWHIIKAEGIENSARSPGKPMHVLHLSTKPLEELTVADIDTPVGPVARHLAKRAIQLANEDRLADKPRVVLSSHMRRLYIPLQRPEVLHSWSDIDLQLQKFGLRLAKMLLDETVSVATAA